MFQRKAVVIRTLLILGGLSAGYVKAQSYYDDDGSTTQFIVRVIKSEFDPYTAYVGPQITVRYLQTCDGANCVNFHIRYRINGIKFRNGKSDYTLGISVIRVGINDRINGKVDRPDQEFGIESVSAAGYGELEYYNPDDAEYDGEAWQSLLLKLPPSAIQQGAKNGLKVRVRGQFAAAFTAVSREAIITLDQRAFAVLQKTMGAN